LDVDLNATQFLSEPEHLLVASADDKERDVLEAVHRLGLRCRDDHNLALRHGW